MFDNLREGLRGALKKIVGASDINEELIDSLCKDVQRALLQSDVNVRLVLSITQNLKERALKERAVATSGESTWVWVLPWNVKASRSDVKPHRRSSWNAAIDMSSAPGMSAAHAKAVVARSMPPGAAVTSHAHDTLVP